MGIPGLLPVLSSITRDVHIQEFKGMTAAVDGYCWLHRGAYTCSQELVTNTPTDKHIRYCLAYVDMMLHHGVTPLIVFDGDKLPMKKGKEEEREASRAKNRAKGIQYSAAGMKAEANECYQKAVDISPSIAHQFIQGLHKRGVKYIVAPYEADAQLAYLARNGMVDVVISEDSDLIPYGCPRVVFKMDRQGHGKMVSLRNLGACEAVNFVGWSHEMVLQMCILAGCDYLPSLPGMGIKTAHKYIREWRAAGRALSALKAERGAGMPESYIETFTKAELTFNHQRVFCPQREEVVPLKDLPQDIEGVDDFLGPPIEKEEAIAIATGKIDPITRRRFDESLVNRKVQIKGRTYFGDAKNKESVNDPPQHIQGNKITQYIVNTPASKAVQRPFQPPAQRINKRDPADTAALAHASQKEGVIAVKKARTANPFVSRLGNVKSPHFRQAGPHADAAVERRAMTDDNKENEPEGGMPTPRMTMPVPGNTARSTAMNALDSFRRTPQANGVARAWALSRPSPCMQSRDVDNLKQCSAGPSDTANEQVMIGPEAVQVRCEKPCTPHGVMARLPLSAGEVKHNKPVNLFSSFESFASSRTERAVPSRNGKRIFSVYDGTS